MARELGQLYRDHCRELVALLESQQRDTFYILVGQPLAWFEIPHETLELLTNSARGLQQGRASYQASRADVHKANEMRVEHNRVSGDDLPEYVDYLLILFLEDSFFVKQLELDDVQSKTIREFLQNVHEFCTVGTADHKTRTAELLRGEAKYPHPVENALLRRQKDWLRQTEL